MATKLTLAQIYADARQAGFDPASAVIAAAIALAESGGRPDAIGDVSLETATWGPSVGLMQIRTLKAQTGTGGTRDITQLSDPMSNLVAAYSISGGGKDWSPWTTYNTGAYRQYLDQAAAAAHTYVPGASSSTGSIVPTSLGSGLIDSLQSKARTLVLQLGAIVLGGALVVAGAVAIAGARDG